MFYNLDHICNVPAFRSVRDLHTLCTKGLYSSVGLSLPTKHCAFLWPVSVIGKAYAPVRYKKVLVKIGVSEDPSRS